MSTGCFEEEQETVREGVELIYHAEGDLVGIYRAADMPEDAWFVMHAPSWSGDNPTLELIDTRSDLSQTVLDGSLYEGGVRGLRLVPGTGSELYVGSEEGLKRIWFDTQYGEVAEIRVEDHPFVSLDMASSDASGQTVYGLRDGRVFDVPSSLHDGETIWVRDGAATMLAQAGRWLYVADRQDGLVRLEPGDWTPDGPPQEQLLVAPSAGRAITGMVIAGTRLYWTEATGDRDGVASTELWRASLAGENARSVLSVAGATEKLTVAGDAICWLEVLRVSCVRDDGVAFVVAEDRYRRTLDLRAHEDGTLYWTTNRGLYRAEIEAMGRGAP